MNTTKPDRRHRLPRRLPRTRFAALPAIVLALALAGCDADGVGVVGPGSRNYLVSGSYDYRAWSDRYRDLVWWGEVHLRVDSSGRITGSYRLPRQCSDRFGPGADCVGRIGGRVDRDGFVRLGFDEGWLSHEGWVDRRSDVSGDWWTRILGHGDEGRFELRRY
jgi:hypothetical protein